MRIDPPLTCLVRRIDLFDLHIYYRCPAIGVSRKPAMIPDPADDNTRPKTVIELKGAAGYCLAPPSPAACHPTGRPYMYAGDHDLTQIPTITPGERDILLACARRLNAYERPARVRPSPPAHPVPAGLLRPGDAFNAEADWADILTPHGWTWVSASAAGSDQWCRPGKTGAVSATTGFAGSDLMYVFSTNAGPFDIGVWYTKFHAFTLLDHAGDFSAAATALFRRGFGGGRTDTRLIDPLARYSAFAPRSLRTD